MDSSIFLNSKDVFLDTINTKDYVQLDRVSSIYQSLKDSVNKPLKMILLYGKPGTGKSMFLNKLYDDLSMTKKIYLYHTPILDDSEFLKRLAQDLLNVKYDGELNFTQFMQIMENQVIDDIPVVLLDEAQLYSSTLMEKIRLVSDTRKVKFVIEDERENHLRMHLNFGHTIGHCVESFFLNSWLFFIARSAMSFISFALNGVSPPFCIA